MHLHMRPFTASRNLSFSAYPISSPLSPLALELAQAL
jgi:hypothetical protein